MPAGILLQRRSTAPAAVPDHLVLGYSGRELRRRLLGSSDRNKQLYYAARCPCKLVDCTALKKQVACTPLVFLITLISYINLIFLIFLTLLILLIVLGLLLLTLLMLLSSVLSFITLYKTNRLDYSAPKVVVILCMSSCVIYNGAGLVQGPCQSIYIIWACKPINKAPIFPSQIDNPKKRGVILPSFVIQH